MNSLGAQIMAARKQRNYTQEQLAAELHVSRQAVSHWENDRALPDVVMLQRLAEVLSAPQLLSPVDTDEAPAAEPEKDSRGRLSRLAVIAICLLSACVVLLGALLLLEHTSPKAGAQEALIVVTPATEVAYLEERPDLAEDWVGWDVNFSYENVTDVPFKPDCIMIRLYRGEELVYEIEVGYAYLLPHMGSDKLIRGNHPLRWPVGNTDQSITRLECTIYGTDDNGNALSFSGDVHYIREFAPGSEK